MGRLIEIAMDVISGGCGSGGECIQIVGSW